MALVGQTDCVISDFCHNSQKFQQDIPRFLLPRSRFPVFISIFISFYSIFLVYTCVEKRFRFIQFVCVEMICGSNEDAQ